MTNRIAIFLGLAILAFFIVDWLAYDWSMSVFLGKKLADLTEYLAFWR